MDIAALTQLPALVAIDFGNGAGWVVATRSAEGFTAGSALVEATPVDGTLVLALRSPFAPVVGVLVRWHLPVASTVRLLGDHYERGYGDLEWRGPQAERVMPWYVLAQDGDRPLGFGVATQPNAFAHWQVDHAGVSLVLDTRCGGTGVQLGQRSLELCRVVVRAGARGEDAHDAAHAFCKRLCPTPRLAKEPVYGYNDWYYAYGNGTAANIRRDADFLARWTDGLANRPYLVVDGGWYGDSCCAAGPWVPNRRFDDMARLAQDIASKDIRPGIWVRPILLTGAVADGWRLERPNHPNEGVVLDPTVPEVLALAEDNLRTMSRWGYRIIKHDFSTFDLTGRWGFEMLKGRISGDGWAFADRSKTTAEAILGLYRALRRGAGDSLLLGCNVVGHLAAGLVEVQRTGDDTSGLAWERTRKMGVNTLAMRMAQHDAFFAVDADCVGLTGKVPWSLNRQWLDVLARSGTPLFISPDPTALGPEQDQAIRRAYAVNAVPRATSKALDWQETTCPVRWRHADGETTYQWDAPLGASPVCP